MPFAPRRCFPSAWPDPGIDPRDTGPTTDERLLDRCCTATNLPCALSNRAVHNRRILNILRFANRQVHGARRRYSNTQDLQEAIETHPCLCDVGASVQDYAGEPRLAIAGHGVEQRPPPEAARHNLVEWTIWSAALDASTEGLGDPGRDPLVSQVPATDGGDRKVSLGLHGPSVEGERDVRRPNARTAGSEPGLER